LIRQPWMIWYAITLHFLYGSLLLIDEQNSSLALLGGFQHMLEPFGRVATGLTLIVAAALAVLGLAIEQHHKPKAIVLGCLFPQYAIMLTAMFSSVELFFEGIKTAQGQDISLTIVLFAVGPIALTAFWHSAAILEKLTRPTNPDDEIAKLRKRIIDLELERRDIDPYHA
jgi:hypothetical protein